MNTKIITAIAMISVVMCSCSSMYKATSTPDDVYYSPSPAVKVHNNNANDDQYEDYVSSNDDRYLRMKVQNRALWSGIDDYSYWQDSRYDFGYSCNSSRFALMNAFNSPYAYSMNNPWGRGFGFGYGYGYYGGFGGGGYWGSPYQTIVLYKNPKAYFGTTSKTNLTAYRNIQYNNGAGYKANGYRYNNSNNGFVNGNTNSRNNTYYNNNTNSQQPARSFNAGSSNNNAGGRSGGYNSSGSSAPASRPTRH